MLRMYIPSVSSAPHCVVVLETLAGAVAAPFSLNAVVTFSEAAFIAIKLIGTSSFILHSSAMTGTGPFGLGDALAGGSGGINLTTTACQVGVSSRHTGGFQAGLGDGSVRFISSNINHNRPTGVAGAAGAKTPDSLYEYLLGINDGNVAGDF